VPFLKASASGRVERTNNLGGGEIVQTSHKKGKGVTWPGHSGGRPILQTRVLDGEEDVMEGG